jgi:hypothetical protein
MGRRTGKDTDMTITIARWARRRRRPWADAAPTDALAVVPAVGPLPPLVVRTTPEQLASHAEN